MIEGALSLTLEVRNVLAYFLVTEQAENQEWVEICTATRGQYHAGCFANGHFHYGYNRQPGCGQSCLPGMTSTSVLHS